VPPAPAAPAADGALGPEAAPDAYQLALDAARSGHTQDAVEILTREVAQEPSGRGRFQRRVQLAQICLGAGQAALARPILEDLAAEIERRKLEEWEAPDLVAHALTLLYKSMEKTDASSEEKSRTYNRICRLDPMQALAIRR
jgi:type VI secretion system protein ImpA